MKFRFGNFQELYVISVWQFSGVMRIFGLATFRSYVKFRFGNFQVFCEIAVWQLSGVM